MNAVYIYVEKEPEPPPEYYLDNYGTCTVDPKCEGDIILDVPFSCGPR